MLIDIDGDLLKSDCTVIMHQANCRKAMGAGIAKFIAEIYPESAQADMNSKLSPKERFGKFTHYSYENLTVVNLYGQLTFGRYGVFTNYEKLENAVDEFLKYGLANKLDLSKVGIPYKIGSGLAGGDWDIVRAIFERQSKKHDVNIYIYKL